MSDTVTREEHKTLQDRVSVVEREVDGEKMLSRYILQQARANGDDLAAVKTRLDRVETDVRQDISEARRDISALTNDLAGLRKELPTIVADAMREVLRESRKSGGAT
jgi:uncharacterized protein YoxC